MTNAELIDIIREIDSIAGVARGGSENTVNLNGEETVLINPKWLKDISRLLYQSSDKLATLISEGEAKLECQDTTSEK